MADPPALALVYADTLVTALPLILVVGHASEALRTFAACAPLASFGTYALSSDDRDGACERRNRAYRHVAEAAGESGRRSLRHLAAERRASPIVFAEIVPVPPPSAANDGGGRANVATAVHAAIDARLDALLSLDALFSADPGRSRVTLVALDDRGSNGVSCRRDDALAHAAERLASRCTALRVPLVTLDLLSSAGTSERFGRAEVGRDAIERLRCAVKELSKLPLVGAGGRAA